MWRKCAECGLGILCKSCYSPSAHGCRECNNLRRLTSDEQRYFQELSWVAWEEVIDAAGQNISVLTVDFSGTPSLSNDNLGCLTQTLFMTFMELFWSDKEMRDLLMNWFREVEKKRRGRLCQIGRSQAKGRKFQKMSVFKANSDIRWLAEKMGRNIAFIERRVHEVFDNDPEHFRALYPRCPDSDEPLTSQNTLLFFLQEVGRASIMCGLFTYLGGLTCQIICCLLYTSPSPRDRG